MKNVKKLMYMLYTLILMALVLISTFIIPPVQNYIEEKELFSWVFFGVGGAFTVIALALVYLTKRSNVQERLRMYLMMAGVSAASFLIGGILHNVFYAIAEVTENTPILPTIAQAVEVTTFLIATIGSPILFLIGAAGSIRTYSKEKI